VYVSEYPHAKIQNLRMFTPSTLHSPEPPTLTHDTTSHLNTPHSLTIAASHCIHRVHVPPPRREGRRRAGRHTQPSAARAPKKGRQGEEEGVTLEYTFLGALLNWFFLKRIWRVWTHFRCSHCLFPR
jgi:hypothetical protein